jgi:hypothetical protein
MSKWKKSAVMPLNQVSAWSSGSVLPAIVIPGIGPKVAEHLIERVGAAVGEASCRICIAVQVQPLLGVAASATVEAG